jgi:hypothetical protein
MRRFYLVLAVIALLGVGVCAAPGAPRLPAGGGGHGGFGGGLGNHNSGPANAFGRPGMGQGGFGHQIGAGGGFNQHSPQGWTHNTAPQHPTTPHFPQPGGPHSFTPSTYQASPSHAINVSGGNGRVTSLNSGQTVQTGRGSLTTGQKSSIQALNQAPNSSRNGGSLGNAQGGVPGSSRGGQNGGKNTMALTDKGINGGTGNNTGGSIQTDPGIKTKPLHPNGNGTTNAGQGTGKGAPGSFGAGGNGQNSSALNDSAAAKLFQNAPPNIQKDILTVAAGGQLSPKQVQDMNKFLANGANNGTLSKQDIVGGFSVLQQNAQNALANNPLNNSGGGLGGQNSPLNALLGGGLGGMLPQVGDIASMLQGAGGGGGGGFGGGGGGGFSDSADVGAPDVGDDTPVQVVGRRPFNRYPVVQPTPEPAPQFDPQPVEPNPIVPVANEEPVAQDAEQYGMQITQVMEGGAAAQADLRVGDIILSVRGLRVQSLTDIQSAFAAAPGEAEVIFFNPEKKQVEKLVVTPVNSRIGVVTEPVAVR